jgi:hypothetical protein
MRGIKFHHLVSRLRMSAVTPTPSHTHTRARARAASQRAQGQTNVTFTPNYCSLYQHFDRTQSEIYCGKQTLFCQLPVMSKECAMFSICKQLGIQFKLCYVKTDFRVLQLGL